MACNSFLAYFFNNIFAVDQTSCRFLSVKIASHSHTPARYRRLVVEDIACGAGSLFGFPGRLNVTHCRQRLATAATLILSCVGKALGRGDGPHHFVARFGAIPRV